MADPPIALQQVLDQAGTLARAFVCVELPDFLERRNTPDHIEVNAPQKGLIACRRVRRDLVCLVSGFNQLVDAFALGRHLRAQDSSAGQNAGDQQGGRGESSRHGLGVVELY